MVWILRNSSPRSKKHCSLAKSIICQQLIISEFSYLVYSLSFHTWKTLYVIAVKFNSSVMKNLQTKAVVHQIPGFCSFAFFSLQVFFFFNTCYSCFSQGYQSVLLSNTNSRLFSAEMLRMQFMEGTVMIMASVGFVWSSPGLTEVGVGGPAVGGVGLLQEDLISEFLFQVCSFQTQ